MRLFIRTLSQDADTRVMIIAGTIYTALLLCLRMPSSVSLHSVPYNTLVTLVSLKVCCGPWAGWVVSLCLSRHSSVTQHLYSQEGWSQDLRPWVSEARVCTPPLAYVASIGKNHPFQVMGETAACSLSQSSLVPELRLKAAFHSHIFTPRVAEDFLKQFPYFPRNHNI